MRPHRWERVLSHQGTRRTDTKHQECCATIMQILPPAFPLPHECADLSPGLVVTRGYGRVPRSLPVGDTELSALQVDTDAGPVRYGYREMKRRRSARHEEQRGMGNPVAWLPNLAVELSHPNPRA